MTDLDSTVIETLKSTGCLTPSPQQDQIDWWKFETEALNDMLEICEAVRDQAASEHQKTSCCGSKDCSISECTHQTSWINGNI